MARRACSLNAYDQADRPLIAAAPHLLASFSAWLRASDQPAIRGSIEQPAPPAPPPAEPPPPEQEPEHQTSAASAYQRTWREEHVLPYLSFSEDAEIAGDYARWEEADAEEDDGAAFCYSCSICQSPARTPHHVRVGHGWQICCAGCARFLYRRTDDFGDDAGDSAIGGPITWDFDFEQMQRRLNSPPWTPGQRR